MESEQLKLELRDVLVKLESSIKVLIDGKPIPSYWKLIGVRDKLVNIIQNIDNVGHEPQEMGNIVDKLKQASLGIENINESN